VDDVAVAAKVPKDLHVAVAAGKAFLKVQPAAAAEDAKDERDLHAAAGDC